MGQGLCVNPLKTDAASGPKSLADVIRQVDNQGDLHEFILSHEGNPGAVASEQVKYERHPVSSTLFLECSTITNTIRHSVVLGLFLLLLLLWYLRNQAPKISACQSCRKHSPRIIPLRRRFSHRRAVIDCRNHLIPPRRPSLRPQPAQLHTQSQGRLLRNPHLRSRCQWEDLPQWTGVCNRISLH